MEKYLICCAFCQLLYLDIFVAVLPLWEYGIDYLPG